MAKEDKRVTGEDNATALLKKAYNYVDNKFKVARGEPVTQPTAKIPTANASTVPTSNTAAREKLGTQFPQGRTVAISSPPGLQRDGIQSKRIDPATQSSFKRAMQSPSTVNSGNYDNTITLSRTGETAHLRGNDEFFTDAQGRPIPRLSSNLSNAPTNPNLNGTMRAGVGGTMDVTFDKSTPLAARKAFMENPVKPVGQMAMFDRREQAWADQVAAKNAQLSQPRLMTKADDPSMTARERIALNDQVSETQRQGLADSEAMKREELQARTLESNQRASLEAGAGVNAAQAESYNSETEARRQKMQQEKEMAGQQSVYMNGTPEQKKQLEELWLAQSGKTRNDGTWQTLEEPILTPEGIPTEETMKTPVFIDRNGNATKLSDMVGKPKKPLTKGVTAALAALKAGEGTKEQFIDTYPEYADYLD